MGGKLGPGDGPAGGVDAAFLGVARLGEAAQRLVHPVDGVVFALGVVAEHGDFGKCVLLEVIMTADGKTKVMRRQGKGALLSNRVSQAARSVTFYSLIAKNRQYEQRIRMAWGLLTKRHPIKGSRHASFPYFAANTACHQC